MKIAHIQSHGGINGVTTSLATLIRHQVASGDEIMLVHRPASWLARTLSDLPIVTVQTAFTTRLREFYRVGDAIRRWGAKVIHTHGSGANKYGAVYRIAGDIPIVATAASCHFQLPWVFANRVIAPSQRTAEYHHRINRVRRGNLRVIPHMIDCAVVPPWTAGRRRDQRALLSLPEGAFVLGMIGTVCARKNQIDSVRVVQALRESGIDARLVLIGEQKYDDHLIALEKLVANAGLEDVVRMTGEIVDAANSLPAFDVYISSSRHEECPIAHLEAMATGLPIISTDVGCMNLLVTGGRGGKLFAIGDVTGMTGYAAKLAADAALRTRTGSEARDIAIERLHPGVILPQIDAVYREIALAA